MDNVEKKRSLRLQFFDWIYESYDISFLPKYVFVNFDLVFKGKYKNLKKPIPIEDLWDMWRKKLPDLKKMHESQRRKGKSLNNNQWVSYDLVIIMSKYDSYLQWKEEQKLAQVELQTVKDNTIDYNKITTNNKIVMPDTNNEIDIDSILDEI